MNRRAFISRAALGAAAAVLGLFALPAAAASQRAAVNRLYKTPKPYDEKALTEPFPGIEPNPEWEGAAYEIRLVRWCPEDGKWRVDESVKPFIRGTFFDVNGKLIPIHPLRFKDHERTN